MLAYVSIRHQAYIADDTETPIVIRKSASIILQIIVVTINIC